MENEIKVEKEKCIVCEAETPYTVETPIDKRYYYVEGAGQLCEHCYDQIYIHGKTIRNIINNCTYYSRGFSIFIH